jgi:hypothetical protein
MQHMDQTQIQYECDGVWMDIVRLREELIPLRQRRAELEEALSQIDDRQVMYDRTFWPKARQFPWSRVKHKITPNLLRERRRGAGQD